MGQSKMPIKIFFYKIIRLSNNIFKNDVQLINMSTPFPIVIFLGQSGEFPHGFFYSKIGVIWW
jgi:hypothetical protein